jgi:hypothetical protein
MSDNDRITRQGLECTFSPHLVYSTPHNFRRRIIGVLRKVEVMKVDQNFGSPESQIIADEIETKLQLSVQIFKEIISDCLIITTLEKRHKLSKYKSKMASQVNDEVVEPIIDTPSLGTNNESQDVNIIDVENVTSENPPINVNVTSEHPSINVTFTEHNVNSESDSVANIEMEISTQGQVNPDQENNFHFDMNDLDDIDEIIRNNVNIDKREFGLLMNSISLNAFNNIPTEGCVEVENINVVPLE